MTVKWDCSYLNAESTRIRLSVNEGHFCFNWAKCVENMGPERDPLLPKGFITYRSVICKAREGSCPDIGECASDFIREEKTYKGRNVFKPHYMTPDYVPLAKGDTEYKEAESGRIVSYNPEAPFDNRHLNEPTKYIDTRYASLIENFPPVNGKRSICSMPTKVTGSNPAGKKIPPVAVCFATMKEGVVTCPSVKACVENPIEYELVRVAAKSPGGAANTELALEPSSSRLRRGQSLPEKTHDPASSPRPEASPSQY